MYATVSLVGPEQFDLEVRVLLVQAGEVVGVDQPDIALAGVDGLQQGGVVGEHVGGQVIHPPLEDGFGLGRAVGFDQGGGQRLVVDLLAGAQAQAAGPALVGQGFVGRQLRRFNPLGGIDDGPCTQRQAGPAAGARAVLGRNVLFDDRRLQRLEHAFLLGLPEVAGVHGDQQVGRGVGAFGLQPRHQRRFLVGDELDLDPGLGGVGVEYRLDQLVDPRGINHHFIGRQQRHRQGGKSQAGKQRLAQAH